MKKFAWTFTIGDDVMSGDADTREQAQEAMQAIGYIEGEMEGAILERSDEELVAASRRLPLPKSSLAHLAKANEQMFKQLDGLKNLVATLENKLAAALFERRMFHLGLIDAQMWLDGIKDMVLAWNTEQHARVSVAYREPAFVALLREFRGFKALEKRKEKHEQEKVESEGSTEEQDRPQ